MSKVWMALAIVVGAVALSFIIGFWAFVIIGVIWTIKMIIKAINRH